LHYEQDEFWYILKGEFLFKVGEEPLPPKRVTRFLAPGMFLMLSQKLAKEKPSY